jgi:exodeoxyribonuclease VII small subunit
MKDKNQNYNAALQRIEDIVRHLEEGEPDLDKMSEMVKEATALISFCKERLKKTGSDLDKALNALRDEE